MSLDWGKREEDDAGRAKRLAGSYVAAAVLVATLLGAGIAFGGQIKKQVFEEEVDVKFVPPEPVKPAPPPPPPPPAPPPPRLAAHTPAALGQKRDAPPTELPKEAPREGDPDDAKPEGPAGEGDPNGVLGGTGRGGVAAKPVETAPPAPPAPPAPILQIAEVSTPPVPRAKAMPAYPDDARKQGIEAVVVVKFVVDESGQVTDVKLVKGHPLFDEVVLAAVRSWTFEPATLEGKPVRMARMVKIPFRLKS